jgi:ATP-binding cassette, subfamily F, member 3
MITLQNIYIQYADRILLNGISTTIKDGERVGLVGRNGAGKSTILKVLASETNPQEGEVLYPTGTTIGYLHQDMFMPKGKTVMEEALSAFAELKKMEDRMHHLQEELTVREDYETDAYMNLIGELSDLSERIHLLGGDSIEADTERILKGLGFKDRDFQRLTDEFSGGWQMRIELAKMLLSRPDVLLLDEPTNHLDIESILWLENWIQNSTGIVVTISHDKRFLDNTTNRTIEIELGKLYDYKASYTKAMIMRAERRALLQNAYSNQQKVINDRQKTIDRFMASATKTSMAQSMQKQLDKMDKVIIDDEDVASMNIRFPPAPRSGEIVAEAVGLTKSYGALKVLENVDFQILRGERIAFVGQNGQGKTTLAKILVEVEAATKGKAAKGFNVHLGYYAQNQAETLNPNITLLQTMEDHAPPEMRTKLRAILGAYLFSGEDVDKKVVVLSGGERARLAMACMMLRPINFLILDEPTNHLDMLSKEVLKLAVKEYDGTLLVVSHDRDFLSDLTDKTIEFRDHKLHEHLGDINYFLEKRALDDMRDVEKATVLAAANKSANKAPLDAEEKKRQQRAVERAEKRIEDLERDLKTIEKMMAEPNFYEKKESDGTMKKYSAMKAELDKEMRDWEMVVG